MNTRLIAAEYRLGHWSRIMKDRTESGMSVKAYCETKGIHTNVYFYWQRKLREAAIRELDKEGEAGFGMADMTVMRGGTATVPAGWALCESRDGTDPEAVQIEIGKSRVTVTSKTNHELLSRVCRTLMSLC